MKLLALPVALMLTAVALPGLSAAPSDAFADPEDASIRPGVQMYTKGGQCTANFIFTDDANVYIGYAAHCAGLGGSTDTNGCIAGSEPIGTKVQIDGAQYDGTLAYSSWDAMIQAGEPTGSNLCAYNDFALVKIDPRDHDKVSPSVLHFGGPTGLCNGPGAGADVISYGNSGLRFGLGPVAPKQGISLGTSAGGWTTTVYMASPGVPGDSGSGYMLADHCAFGVTSTLALAPYVLSNGISSLALGLQYAADHGFEVELETAEPLAQTILL